MDSVWPLSPSDLPRTARRHTSIVKAIGFWHFGQVLNEPKQSIGNPKNEP